MFFFLFVLFFYFEILTNFFSFFLFLEFFLSFRRVSFIFGAITMTSGILGVPLGSYLSQKLIKRFPRIDPLICGAGLFISAPFLTLALYYVSSNTVLTYTFIFFGELALNMNWAIVADILLVRISRLLKSNRQNKCKFLQFFSLLLWRLFFFLIRGNVIWNKNGFVVFFIIIIFSHHLFYLLCCKNFMFVLNIFYFRYNLGFFF